MNFEETTLKGAFIIEPRRLFDERGFFTRTFCRKELEAHGLISEVAQANMSFTKKTGTFRGMHYQIAPYQETKLVQCTQGAIFDVIIDLRPDSPTYKKWIGVELSAANGRMLFVPKDFAHGFITLEDNTSVNYLVSQFYTPASERGIKWDDPQFGIQLPIPISVISEKDQSHSFYQL
ncbi:dTDP-4-dehydrorhamnose 3,5-epimerase [Lunatimonas lonarensis]|uniref:dTDP-4-dehydrorhamnose 3,5-epimerase n=1 Tax=Lunatimonas lonarensis TaxID=1232681 RepID=R7ZQZ7_9BACT|nr:dTDP-4-dehydrorhamnose 3,5-epimerase [Lunatimonas lonarensis]EON76540.1 dTDP-4-dehydrorhamnose 3,5-epimerase [Lunatimonas lonarensis]